MTSRLAGRWYDGRSSRAQAVRVEVSSAGLRLVPAAGPPLALPRGAVGWPERFSARRAPATLVVDLREHGSLEIDDVAGWQAAVAAAGAPAPLVQRMQLHWPVFLAVLLVAAAALGVFYRWGTPWAAAVVTRHVPLDWETALSQRALSDLDGRFLQASKLPRERQDALRARFAGLLEQVPAAQRRYAGYRPVLQLQFRRGIGPNAFALPGGTIVLTDEMVEAAAKQAQGDEALLGVLAHEAGHVLHRHTTRMVVEQGVLNVGLGLAMGDLSVLVSTGSSLLTGLAYRRSHESEADCFALGAMRAAGLSTQPMADLLLAIDASAGGPSSEGGDWLSLLRSHPQTAERARLMKSGAAACG